MKNQYMDFVPSGGGARKTTKKTTSTTGAAVRGRAPGTTARAVAAKKPARKAATGATVAKKPARSATARGASAATVKKTAGKVGFSGEKKPKLGAVEDLSKKFVRTDVPKRPLSRGAHFTTRKTGVAAAKAVKVGNQARTSVKSVEKPVENSAKKSRTTVTSGMYQAPKFVNQGQVTKRPLSPTKNVYQKKAAAPKEEPKGPVTIINKPEKQAHVGMVVTIILTIILGAAAGTVAFLLLPK